MEMEDDSSLPLMERIKRKQAAEASQQHYPMKSVANDMDKNEREALQSGSRKRKAPVQESANLPKNIQRKKVNAAGRPKADDSDSDDGKPLEMMVRQRRQAAPKKAIIDDESEEEVDESDEESYDSDEIFGADDDSI